MKTSSYTSSVPGTHKMWTQFLTLGLLTTSPLVSAVTIADIRGTRLVPPLVGQTVNNLVGVVTGIFVSFATQLCSLSY